MKTTSKNIALAEEGASWTLRFPGLLLLFTPFLLVIGLWLCWLFFLAVPVTQKAMQSTAPVKVVALGSSLPASAAAPAGSSALSTSSSAETRVQYPQMSDLGQAGDMFGGLNALFAGLAFAGVAIAAWLQRGTLQSQHRQLTAAHQQQRLAEFEPLFFQLVALFRDLQGRAVVRLNSGTYPLDSNEVDEAVKAMAKIGLRGDGMDQAGAERELRAAYQSFYGMNEQTLGPLFRTLYHAFRLVAESGLDERQKVRYANIARGLLGGQFLLLLMINCISAYGAGFKPYVEFFGLLKHYRTISVTGDHVDREFSQNFFSESAVLDHLQRMEYWKTHESPVMPD